MSTSDFFFRRTVPATRLSALCDARRRRFLGVPRACVRPSRRACEHRSFDKAPRSFTSRARRRHVHHRQVLGRTSRVPHRVDVELRETADGRRAGARAERNRQPRGAAARVEQEGRGGRGGGGRGGGGRGRGGKGGQGGAPTRAKHRAGTRGHGGVGRGQGRGAARRDRHPRRPVPRARSPVWSRASYTMSWSS